MGTRLPPKGFLALLQKMYVTCVPFFETVRWEEKKMKGDSKEGKREEEEGIGREGSE